MNEKSTLLQEKSKTKYQIENNLHHKKKLINKKNRFLLLMKILNFLKKLKNIKRNRERDIGLIQDLQNELGLTATNSPYSLLGIMKMLRKKGLFKNYGNFLLTETSQNRQFIFAFSSIIQACDTAKLAKKDLEILLDVIKVKVKKDDATYCSNLSALVMTLSKNNLLNQKNINLILNAKNISDFTKVVSIFDKFKMLSQENIDYLFKYNEAMPDMCLIMHILSEVKLNDGENNKELLTIKSEGLLNVRNIFILSQILPSLRPDASKIIKMLDDNKLLNKDNLDKLLEKNTSVILFSEPVQNKLLSMNHKFTQDQLNQLFEITTSVKYYDKKDKINDTVAFIDSIAVNTLRSTENNTYTLKR